MFDEFNHKFIARKTGKETAESLTAYIERKIEHDVVIGTKHLPTKEDLTNLETRLSQKIYWASLIQILTIIGSILAMFKFFK